MTKKAANLTHFTADEIISAQIQLENTGDQSIEDENDYLERKRERDLQSTVLQIVENELDGIKKDIFKSIFFDGEKIANVSRRLGIGQSNAYKHYNRAIKIIEKNLKYVMFYRESSKDRLTPLEFMKDRAFSDLKGFYKSAFLMRFKRLMLKENVRLEKLSCLLGIDMKRLDEFLKGSIQPNADEIVLISGFFGVSADYMLKGDLT